MELTVEKIIENRAAQVEAGCYYNPEADFLLKQVESQKEIITSLNKGINECRERYERSEARHHKATFNVKTLIQQGEDQKKVVDAASEYKKTYADDYVGGALALRRKDLFDTLT